MHANGRAISLLVALFVVTVVVEGMRPTKAMPPFAQAYGMSCEVCHSVVPALNSYGRYLQRTGYASVDSATLRKANPLWIGESPFYSTQDPVEPNQVQVGNLALHAAGAIGQNWTFHAHQWIEQSDQAGGTDTLWATYNNLFHRDGHLFVGKIEPPAPSPYSQWFDLAGFAAPGITVGEHPWPFANNRWGTKLAYAHNWFTAEAAYLGANGNLNTATDFATADTDKTFQWRLTDGYGYKPLEFGVYGGKGVFPTSDGLIDNYNGHAVYAQLDPQAHLPGALVIYQRGFDDHPGAGLPSATHTAFSGELYQPFASHHGMLGLRDEYTDDGLGNVAHSGNVDLAFLASHHVSNQGANGFILNFEAVLTQNSTPGWRSQLWYVTTIGALKH